MDAWPNGVVTRSDHEKFLQLFFGRATKTDLIHFLPQSQDWHDKEAPPPPCWLVHIVRTDEIGSGKKQKYSKNSKIGRLRVDICSIMQIFSTISLVHREAKSTTARRRSTAIIAPAGLALEATTSGGILVVQEKPPDFIGAGSMKQP